MEPPPTKRKLPCWAKVVIPVAICLVVFAIIIGIVFGVVVPDIVQQRVAGTQLQFTSMSITNPTMTGFHLQGNGTISNAGPDASTIYPTTLTVLYQGNPMGTLPLPQTQVNGGQPTNITLISDFTVINPTVFSQFGNDLVNGNTTTWHLSGYPDVSALGITFKNVDFEKDIPLIGFDGFKATPIIVNTISLVGGKNGSLQLVLNISITNPSSVSMSVGNTTFDLYFNNVFIGNATAVTVLAYGVNTMVIGANFYQTGPYNAPSNDTGRIFLSRFLQGIPNVVTLTGSLQYQNVLQESLTYLKAQTVVPPNSKSLVLESQISVTIIPPAVVTKVLMNNPFATDYTVECMNLNINVTAGNTPLAIIDNFCFGTPVVVPAGSTALSSNIPLNLQTIDVPAAVNVQGTLLVSIPTIGGFRQTLDYVQMGVPAMLF